MNSSFTPVGGGREGGEGGREGRERGREDPNPDRRGLGCMVYHYYYSPGWILYNQSFSVVSESGNELLIHFDGWGANYNYWCSQDAIELHPPGWCGKVGWELQTPQGIAKR